MAKKKKKSDRNMGEFFKLNGEKIGFGVISLIALLLIMFSFMQDSLPEKYAPEKLAQKATATSSKIDDTEANSQVELAINSRVNEKMDLILEAFRIPFWNKPPVEDKPKRTEPAYLPVESLEISYGRGAFCYQGIGAGAAAAPVGVATAGVMPPPGSIAAGEYFVVIRGLVPYKKQIAVYNDTFGPAIQPPLVGSSENAAKSYRLVPVYQIFNLKRAELLAGQSVDKLDWKTVKIMAAVTDIASPRSIKRKTQWATKAAESVHISLTLTGVTPFSRKASWLGLPPLLQRNWKIKEVCHSQLIKANQAANNQGDNPMPVEEPMDNTPEDFGFNGELNSTNQPQPQLAVQIVKPTAGYRLFRYIDFEVQPGKRYVYKVQLRLKNPNLGLASRYIKKAEYGVGKVRETAWSEPSPVAEISADENVLVGSIIRQKRRPKPGEEPSVKVNCSQWLKNEGYSISKSYSRKVGKGKKVKDVFAMRSQWLNLEAPGSYTDPLDGTKKQNQTTGVASKHLVVDFRGGVDPSLKKPRKITPAEMVLLFNSTGQLVIHYPEDDQSQLNKKAGNNGGLEDLEDPGDDFDPTNPEKKTDGPF